MQKLILAFLLLQSAFNSIGQIDTITILPDIQQLKIGKNLVVFVDSSYLSIEQVLTSNQFESNDSDVPNFGITQFPVWASFTVVNRSNNSHFLLNLEYPILDSVSFFVPYENGEYQESSYFHLNGQHSKKYVYPDNIFDFNILPNEVKKCYVRVTNLEQLILPISIYKPESIWSKISLEYLLSGLYAGIMLIMFLYNLFLYTSVKDNNYLIYVVYIFFMGCTHLFLQGYNLSLLSDVFNGTDGVALVISASLAGLFATIFTIVFLQTVKTTKKLHYLLLFICSIYSLSIVIFLAGNHQFGFILMQLNTTLMTISILITSFYLAYSGYQHAKYFSLAWTVLLVCSILFLLKDYGVLPYNIVTKYIMQMGSGTEAALLSFALANKIKILKIEKDNSQREALEMSMENARLVKEQNILLEQEVNERTQELNQSNINLNKALEDLKHTHTRLIQSEKMASLGQLTAGIAHEINNPINFVKSNVRPLKRDIEHLYELIEKYDSIHFPEESSHELEQISAFKEEIESDYLKEEITTLLAGIDEGASRTAKIVEGLKDFSRIGNTSLQEYDLVKGLESSLTILNNRLTSSKILIERNFSSPLIVECFPDRINQVFMNILDNAIDAFDEVNGTKTISIDAEKSIHEVNISITDNGIGMSPEIQNRIFDPFYTSKDVGSGTGLGLSIAYGIMQDHNGSIEVYSQEGKGTTFIIKFTHDNETQNSIR